MTLLPVMIAGHNTDQTPKQSIRNKHRPPMRSNSKATSHESVAKSDEKVAKKPLGDNKHYIPPYGGFGGYGGFDGW